MHPSGLKSLKQDKKFEEDMVLKAERCLELIFQKLCNKIITHPLLMLLFALLLYFEYSKEHL
jgi:hypothetical protein